MRILGQKGIDALAVRHACAGQVQHAKHGLQVFTTGFLQPLAQRIIGLALAGSLSLDQRLADGCTQCVQIRGFFNVRIGPGFIGSNGAQLGVHALERSNGACTVGQLHLAGARRNVGRASVFLP